jgi:hypothetical protein
MAKTKISEYSSTAANNTDVANINIAEGCSPSNLNNAIRAVMSHLKNFQDGSSGDSLTNSGTVTSSGTLNVTGGLQLDGSAGTSGQVMVSAGSGNTPTWGSGFPSGGIIMWSGSVASIPSGWYLCDGNNSTPDLRNRFVVGAGDTYSVDGTGGSADATLVSHTHTATSTVTDPGHFHKPQGTGNPNGGGAGSIFAKDGWNSQPTDASFNTTTNTTGITVATTLDTQGSSATNANLPPYYALAFIMKA